MQDDPSSLGAGTTTERCPFRGNVSLQDGRVLDHDPYEAFLEFAESDPFWADYDGGTWVITRYEHVREVQQNYRVFTHTMPKYKLSDPLMPTEFDPPFQTKLRGIVLPLMTAARIDPLEPTMHEVCRELISGFKDRGHCDVVEEFARKYPIAIFGELFGLEPERREEFRQLAETWMHDVSQRQWAWTEIRAIIRGELEERRVAPKDDMLTGISLGEIDGERIDIETGINLAATVFLGGLDTLPSNIGWTLRFLATNPGHRRRIIEEPECVPGAVEEFFRRFPSVAKNACRATRDLDFHGANIKKGDLVHTILFLANCDGEVFNDPLSLDFDRRGNKHIAFSVGSHRCLGSHLARHELAVGLQEWHAAIPEYRIADVDAITYTGGVLAMTYLPLEWDT